ncbi:hypothetical protein [Companilactobacillus jidongensis]|uniref:hypothetical protein n=1 Tax=Companilactobacillus jidongensis TaxID=2486006 RepID=UPI000F7A9B7E|nr:hypothetical protein [Companilactobacillus jidongensis]
MSSFNEFTLAISAIILVVTSIVGVVLLSTSVFNINASMKKTVNVIEKYQRPYIAININDTNLIIKNTGKSQAIIDSIIVNGTEKLNQFDGKTINPEQSLLTKNNYENQEKLTIEINYHSENRIYKETLPLR